MTELKEVIEGAIHDCLLDWKSEYKISEDLPAIAEIITEEILRSLEVHNYITIKEKELEKVL